MKLYKKYLLGVLVFSLGFVFLSPRQASAFWPFDLFKKSAIQSEDVAGVVKTSSDQPSICQIVDLFIALEIISPDKANAARQAVLDYCSSSSSSSSFISISPPLINDTILVNQPYSNILIANGDFKSVGWGLSAGEMPRGKPGIGVYTKGTNTAILEGTPTVSGKSIFKIRATNMNNPSVWGEINGNINVLEANQYPSVSILSPNGGEVFRVGGTYDIKWSGINFPSNGTITIVLVNDELVSKQYLFSEIINDGFERWTVPFNIPTGKYKIRIFCGIKGTESYCGDNPKSEDLSDTSFNIVNDSYSSSSSSSSSSIKSSSSSSLSGLYVTFISPQGGQITKGNNTEIKWKINETNTSIYRDFGINLLNPNGYYIDGGRIKSCGSNNLLSTDGQGNYTFGWKAGINDYGNDIPTGYYSFIVYDCGAGTVPGKSNLFQLISSSSSSSSSSVAGITATTGRVESYSNGARVYGDIINPNKEDVSYYFNYKKESDPLEATKQSPWTSINGQPSSGAVVFLYNLSPDTRYVYQLSAYSKTTGRTVNGKWKTFKTRKSLPDLNLFDLTVNPTMATVGQEVFLNASISNVGTVATIANYSIDLGYQGIASKSDQNTCYSGINLEPGNACRISLKVKYSSPRSLNTVKIKVDPGNNIKESNEDNNSKEVSFMIVGSGLLLSDLSTVVVPIDNGQNPPATSTVKFMFTMNNKSESDLYVSKTPSTFVATSTTSGSLGSLTLLSADSPTLSGDTSSAYIIPSGSSRKFTLTGTFGKYALTSGVVEFKITRIYYDDDTSGLQEFNIDSGLEALRAISSF